MENTFEAWTCFWRGKSQGRESVMKWSDADRKARNRQRTGGYTRPRMSWKKKPNHNKEFTCLHLKTKSCSSQEHRAASARGPLAFSLSTVPPSFSERRRHKLMSTANE